MEPWLLGLLISLCVVFVFAAVAFLMWTYDRTSPIFHNGLKKLTNTYFIQYITLISAAAAMYDLVVVACTVRKTDTGEFRVSDCSDGST